MYLIFVAQGAHGNYLTLNIPNPRYVRINMLGDVHLIKPGKHQPVPGTLLVS